MKPSWLLFRIITFVAFAAASTLWAQDASVEVVVTDPAGNRIPGATVLLLKAAGTEVGSAQTGSEGMARISSVQAGSYVLRINAENFATYLQDVRVPPSGARFDVSLELASLATTIEVSAPPVQPIAVQETPAERLEEAPSEDLVEQLRSVPGVNTVRRGGTNVEPVVQGLRENQIAMVVDGTRTFAAGPARMDSDLSHVDPGNVKRVQVVTGPYALTEAAGALSAILVETPEAPRFDSWRLRARTSAGYSSNGSGRFARTRLVGGDQSFGFSLRAAGNKGNDYQPGDRGSQDVNIPGDYSNHQLGGKIRINPDDSQEISFGSFYDEQTGIDYPGRILNAEHFILRSWSGKYLLAEPSGKLRSAKFGLYLNKKSHRMSNDRKPTAFDMPGRTPPFALSVSLPTESDTFGGAAGIDLEPARTWRIQTGFDFYDLDQDAQRFVSRRSNGFLIFNDAVWPDASINDQGVYVQTTKTFERGEVAAGVRLDFVQAAAGRASEFFLSQVGSDLDQNEVNTSFSLAGNFRLDEGLSLGGGFGRVVRTANTLERFSDRFPSTKFQVAAEFLGEPGIDPEVSYQGDLALDITAGDLSLQLGGFYRQIDNYVTVAPAAGVPKRLPLSPPVVFRYVSGDHANFRGYHFGLRYWFHPTVQLNVQGAHTIADDIEESIPAVGVNEPVLGIPPFEVNSALRVFAPSKRVWGEFGMRNVWNQQRFAASRLEQPSPGFSTLEVRFGAELPGRFTLHLGLENLGDKFYFEHLNSLNPFTRQRIPEMGRSFYASLERLW